MLIALLIVLGVNLIVIVLFTGFLIGRRRWLRRQPGEFAGAIRMTSGSIDGLGPRWNRGSGRWVRDVLVWNRAPLMLRTELVPVDQMSAEHGVSNAGLKRLAEDPQIAQFVLRKATIEVATKTEHRALLVGPFSDRTHTSVTRQESASASFENQLPKMGDASLSIVVIRRLSDRGDVGGVKWARPITTTGRRGQLIAIMVAWTNRGKAS
jgi:hypothetical protein